MVEVGSAFARGTPLSAKKGGLRGIGAHAVRLLIRTRSRGNGRLTQARKLAGQLQKLIYEAVKSGTMAELSEEEQLFARAMQEHMHLKHIHNALEFADVREGAPYKVEFGGNVVSPLAHVAMRAAVDWRLLSRNGPS
jgi:hypothetical protein